MLVTAVGTKVFFAPVNEAKLLATLLQRTPYRLALPQLQVWCHRAMNMVSASYGNCVTEYRSWCYRALIVASRYKGDCTTESRSHGHHTEPPASSGKCFTLHPCLVDVEVHDLEIWRLSHCRHATVEALPMCSLETLQSDTPRRESPSRFTSKGDQRANGIGEQTELKSKRDWRAHGFGEQMRLESN